MFYDFNTRFKSLKPFIQWRFGVLVELGNFNFLEKKIGSTFFPELEGHRVIGQLPFVRLFPAKGWKNSEVIAILRN